MVFHWKEDPLTNALQIMFGCSYLVHSRFWYVRTVTVYLNVHLFVPLVSVKLPSQSNEWLIINQNVRKFHLTSMIEMTRMLLRLVTWMELLIQGTRSCPG